MASNSRQAWARGGMIFAATIMLIIGVFQIFIGIAAIAQNQLVVVGENYAYNVNTTPWGWIHLVIGVIAAAAGLALFTGATWAKAVAIALAGISAIANFFFLVYYPIWSLVIIALDVFVIWAIASARVGTADDGYATSSTMDAGRRSAMSDPRATDERWPAENPSAGRHWAPDTKEEATRAGQQAQGMAGDERDRATATARGTQQQPPQNPPAS